MKIEIIRGNIVTVPADAIVNAANTDLILGGGVAGAIRAAGGPRIQEECNALAPIRVGEVAATGAGNLPHRYVIHAATMSFENPSASADAVASCTRRALEKAVELRCHSIAFPALGAGVAGLAMRDCARAMLSATRDFVVNPNRCGTLEKIIFVLFDDAAAQIFRETWEQLQQR